MIELSVADFEASLNQILSQVERGEEVIITRQGKAIAKLSTIGQELIDRSNVPGKIKGKLKSRSQLRRTQPIAATSSLETLQTLRSEARY
ncbi:type II toxin-antitoxin system Phd/YefM family antitoxin [Argonema antarcticum]|uniref:type II toxin-antitoxin system Phd/YefM family antitoxin n=1 Tax=Argonema antarcticum TaxID=2942763 RepID=UPI002011247D|nr:type II toxin-antitoxin system prevent-host-death family antitoxin [Argonema antarcticum]MCL1471011.1 type II toxin-antitoxin system prevent-host-death family antitoxin [Argonema antarcticum A004/B2]